MFGMRIYLNSSREFAGNARLDRLNRTIFQPSQRHLAKLRRLPPIRRDAVRFNPTNGAVLRHFWRLQRLTLPETFYMAERAGFEPAKRV